MAAGVTAGQLRYLSRLGGAHRARRPAGLGDPGADFDAEVFAQLYSKLAVTVSAPQTVGGGSRSLLSFMLPGQYLEENLDPRDPYTQYLLANLLNPTLECSWITRKKAATVADVYESILNGKQTPLVELTPEQKAELDGAERLLFQADGEPTAFYADYLTDGAAYLDALDAYDAAAATERNGGPPVPPEIRAALDDADARWRDHGHKSDVDRLLAVIDELEALEPAVYWHQLAERYRDATRRYGQDSQFQHTLSTPEYPRWFDDEGWTAFAFDDKDLRNQDRSGGVGVGDCCICPGGLGPRSYGGFHSTVDDFAVGAQRVSAARPAWFRLTAQVRRIEILRPWLDPVVLGSRAWRWSDASSTYGVVVSSGGNLAAAVVPTGVMPVLPTTALLAKDVEIDWSDGGQLQSRLRQRQSLDHELRYGPFRVTGASIVDNHISWRQPQLIGYISDVLPASPDPDPRLPWPKRRHPRAG